jgi:Fe2+ or Zn2+ uptake regulation protein
LERLVKALPDEHAAAMLRKKGLRPTANRVRVLQSLLASQGDPMRTEEVYRSLIVKGTPNNLGSISHAMIDMERAGLLEVVERGTQRKRYRCASPGGAPALTCMRLQTEGREASINDPRLLEMLTRFLVSDLGVVLAPETKTLSLRLSVTP